MNKWSICKFAEMDMLANFTFLVKWPEKPILKYHPEINNMVDWNFLMENELSQEHVRIDIIMI